MSHECDGDFGERGVICRGGGEDLVDVGRFMLRLPPRGLLPTYLPTRIGLPTLVLTGGYGPTGVRGLCVGSIPPDATELPQ
eukprot:454759-Rhodomonas_salina.1